MDAVYTEDTSSGKVHIRVRDGGRLLVDERCNLDDAGHYRVLTMVELEIVERDRLCKSCFPEEAK